MVSSSNNGSSEFLQNIRFILQLILKPQHAKQFFAILRENLQPLWPRSLALQNNPPFLLQIIISSGTRILSIALKILL